MPASVVAVAAGSAAAGVAGPEPGSPPVAAGWGESALALSASWVTPEPGLESGSEAEVSRPPVPPSPLPLDGSSGWPP